MPVGDWLVLLVALAVVALDVSVTAPWTGLPVFLGMLLVVLGVAERMAGTTPAAAAEYLAKR